MSLPHELTNSMQKRLARYIGAIAIYPAPILLGWYVALSAAGTLLLLLPACRLPGAGPLSLTDAMFTATSAASVTGLMVVSTETQLSAAGQGVVLALIQLGGLGVMTIGTLLFVSVTGRQPVRFHLFTKQSLGAPLSGDVQRLVLLVIGVTLLFESVGTVALLLARLGDGPFAEVLWWSVFHAVSGFCNSGISLQDASLAPWSGDPAVILTMSALIVSGGLGFPVLLDMFHLRRRSLDRRSLRFHSKLVLSASAILLTVGALATWLLERNGALGDLPAGQAAMNALFQSVTARSAGFNTVTVENFAYPTIFLLMMLMVIGGSSGSTAGGVKVSTVSILALEGISHARRKWQTAAFGRRVPERMLRVAATVMAVYLTILVTGFMFLLILETPGLSQAESEGYFLDLAFEAVSALGTVGLSTGATGELGEASRLVVITMMLLGRVGPLAIASALLAPPKGPKIRYPESEVIIG